MSLNAVSEGISDRLRNNDPTTFLTEGVPPVNEGTEGLTNPHMPGGFPNGRAQDDDNEEYNIPPLSSIPSMIFRWVKGAVPTTADLFETGVKQFVSWICPPARQLALYEATLSHPIAATFLICQLICCGVPILVFLAGTFLFLAVSILLWAILSFLILGPVLVVASMAGVSIWTWGWIIYGFVRLTDKLFLGGMLTRLWISQAEQYGEELRNTENTKDGGEN